MAEDCPEFLNKSIESWSEDDVAQWLESCGLYYSASLPMRELDGRALSELLFLIDSFQKSSKPNNWYEYLSESLTIDGPTALKFSHELRQLMLRWKMMQRYLEENSH